VLFVPLFNAISPQKWGCKSFLDYSAAPRFLFVSYLNFIFLKKLDPDSFFLVTFCALLCLLFSFSALFFFENSTYGAADRIFGKKKRS